MLTRSGNELFVPSIESGCVPLDALPLELVICGGKNAETIRLLDLEKGDIRVATCWTKLLPAPLWPRSSTKPSS